MTMSEFTAGFSARGTGVADALKAAFALPAGFAPADLRERAVSAPVSFAPRGDGPKHFSPLDRASNPTEGWDPFDARVAAAPFVDPIAAAHAAGYAEGVAAAIADAASAHARDAALLADLAAALRADERIDRAAMARSLRQTVLLLVTRLVGDVIIPPETLARRVDAAAAMLVDAAESAMLRVHPDDVALLEGHLPATVFPIGDVSIARGSFILESASTIIEDGPDLWLEQLAQAVDRVGVPA